MKRRVLITGAGSAGIKGTLYSLKIAEDVFTVSVDCDSNVLGKYLCDKFYQIYPASNPCFILQLIDICKKENVDVLLPQVNEELRALSFCKKRFEDVGTKIAISSNESILCANNKDLLMNVARQLHIPVPKHYVVNKRTDLEDAISKLGYPENRVVIKPPFGRGMQGFRVLDANIDRTKLFFGEKLENASMFLKREELNFLGEKFPTLLVTEYLSGIEYSIDVLSNGGKVIVAIPRKRTKIRTGITFNGIIEKRSDLIKFSKKLTEKLRLEYAHGYQFKEDGDGIPKILECNPRIQGSMVLATLSGANIIYGAYKLCLGEELPRFRIKWGTQLVRDWGGIYILDGRKIGEF